MAFLLLLATISISGSGCSTAPPADVAIGCADPPILDPMTQDMRERTDADVVTWVEATVGDVKAWGIENCRRIRAHDARFEP